MTVGVAQICHNEIIGCGFFRRPHLANDESASAIIELFDSQFALLQLNPLYRAPHKCAALLVNYLALISLR